DDLQALEEQPKTAGAPLAERVNKGGDPLTDDEAAGLRKLAGVVTSVRKERERRVGEAASKAADTKANADAAAVFATDDKAEAVTADASAKAPSVADVARNGTGAANAGVVEEESRTAKMVAAPNLPHLNAGTVFKDLGDVARACEHQFASYPRGVPGQYIKNPVMYLQRDFPPELTIKENASSDDILRVLEYAGSEARLEGNSLVAAAGWCAPSQIDYGLFELEGTAGLLDLPEMQISRGGIQFTTGPDFSTIFGGSGFWHQTEAQVIAATTKPCMVISCPSFTEKRLEVEGVCITGAFLQDRGYPEMVQRFVRGALKAHVRKLNIFKINQVVAGSTLFDYTNVANLPVTTSEYKDLTVASRLLALIGIQAVDYRYKYRMDPEASLECILPYWLLEQIRADVQRRTALDPDAAFKVAMSQVNSWFSARGIRCQWIYDWLDTYNSTNTSTVGQTAGVYTLPTTVEAILYAAGTFVAGVADVVRLDTVYDSTNLALNQYTQLFTEEGILVAKRGFESRRIKTTISPSGTTSATTNMVQG
ncbi:MAG TPA: major capsid protein, partial [Micromonosporaceae bacterium]|nr:major capsid protein [Micromonosporaceae bacterium]